MLSEFISVPAFSGASSLLISSCYVTWVTYSNSLRIIDAVKLFVQVP